MKRSGVILAAGLSRRMGFPKALLLWKGETYLDRMIRMFGGVCDEVIVVLRPGQEWTITVRGAETVFNPDAERGQLSSLQTGLAAATGSAILFSPVDYAHVAESTIAQIASAQAADVVQPEYRGQHGHPVAIRAAVAAALLAAPVESAARDVIRRFDRVFVNVDDAGVTIDADDPAAYAAIQEVSG